MKHYFISLVLLLCILQSTCGLYFLMREKERKCFVEETPEDTDVIVDFRVEVEDPRISGGFMPLPFGLGMHMEVRDSDGKVLLSRVYGSEACVKFTTFWPGPHRICLKSNSTALFQGALLRVHLDIKKGDRAIDLAKIQREENLDNMQLRVLQLLNQADAIQKGLNYQRFIGDRFQQQISSLYSEMVFIAIAQVVVLLIFMVMQYRILFKKPSLYLAYCKVFNDEELSRFRTLKAYKALMNILGSNGEGLTTNAISQWLAQLQDPESTDENEQIIINDRLQVKVKEFADKFSRKPSAVTPETPKGSYFASNLQLTNLLVSSKRNPSDHLHGDTFLLVCECDDCKAKNPEKVYS
ncbi:transmembrane emp24 domain-containing protein eca-like [Drosophila ficusphila]|uniref:transmembrane emp24 domain-containing protein eca-like n=1 Tax=Drosophila ficusphila TaxID=30025 RepID=UPI0007E5EF37|nr:transmembrane emp24 domain-containing protein eca-like [Drosophila ficusphila]